MKKVILAVMFASIMAVGAQAQLFVGGTIFFSKFIALSKKSLIFAALISKIV